MLHPRSLAGVALLLAGCGAYEDLPEPSALRAAFPEQATAVLERGEGAFVGERGFSWTAPPDAGAWVRVEAELPRDGAEPIRLRVRDFEVRVREIGAEGGREAVERAVAYRRAGGTSYWTAASGVVEEWLHLTGPRGDVAAAWEVEGGRLEQHGEHLAVLDHAGVARLWVSAPAAYEPGGRPVPVTLKLRGERIELHVDSDAEEVLVDPAWTAAAPMANARIEFKPIVLGAGGVLVAGGRANSSPITNVERYDPLTNMWSALPSLPSAQRSDSAAVLSDGRIVIVSAGGLSSPTSIFNPATGTWSTGAPPPEFRTEYSATLLDNGKVLIGGGFGIGGAQHSRVYDPVADTFSAAIPMGTARYRHGAVRLGNGKVLVAGGLKSTLPQYLASAELFDPLTNSWSPAATMAFPRTWVRAALLPDGKVLVAGGFDGSSGRNDAEIYDPVTNTWSLTGTMTNGRYAYTATSLPSGKVLITGGATTAVVIMGNADVYDPFTNLWSPAGVMSVLRTSHGATLLPNGSALVCGGGYGSTFHTSCDLYSPVADGVACSGGGECVSGFCAGGVCCDTPCDGVCDTCLAAEGAPQDGVCGVKTDGATCDDNNACTQTDTCQAGLCEGASPAGCAALDDCHDAGACDPATGVCSNPPKADGSPCTDNDLCTLDDVCQAGSCQPGAAPPCALFGQCAACDPQTGFCKYDSATDGAGCDDGNACTQSDVCQGGACEGSSPVLCTTGNQCLTAGICDPASGCPVPALKPQGTPCDDGNACTHNDTCQSGACQAGTATTCVAIDQCHAAGACDPMTGLCGNPEKPNGASCNDGDACTQSDACQDGACVGANKVCPAPGACHDPAACDSMTGLCVYPNKPSGAPCDDGNACTSGETCDGAGACQPGSPVVCVAIGPCHDPGTCDPKTGACDNPQKPTGALCDDADQCTENTICNAQGQCGEGSSITCAVTDECQIAGACDPQAGCPALTAKADGTPCGEIGNLCGNAGTCQGGTCVGEGPKVCPGGPCTEGHCDPATGACLTKPKPEGAACSDGNICTANDACSAGICEGIAIQCPAIDACHEPGACHPATGQCVNKEIPNCSVTGGEGGTPAGPPPKAPSAAVLCSTSAECPSDRPYCVDGVCCNEACSGACLSCVQPGQIGECVPSKRGVDLRHDCAPLFTCEATCDGNGACVKASEVIGGGDDVQCAPNQCADDGIHLLGVAYCSAAGADCPTTERDAWSCAPYRCINALGACGTTCEAVGDCAPPFVCDPSKRCVPPPAVASGQDGSCALTPGGSGAGAAFVLIAIVVSSAARIRRRSRAGR